MKNVFRKGWVSVLLLTITFLALTPASLISAAAISIEPTFRPSFTFAPSTTTVFTERTYRSEPGFTFSSSHSTTIIPISIPSMYIFDYAVTMNAPAGTAGSTWPGTADAGKCSNTQSCLITIDDQGNPSIGCAEYCGSATVTISVDFPSSQPPEPVTLTVSGLPAGVTFSWGNELQASSLAPYTAMPPYSVTLGIYTNSFTPLYGSPNWDNQPPVGNNTPPAIITITSTSHNSFPHHAKITLTVNSQLPACLTANQICRTVTYPGWTTTTLH